MNECREIRAIHGAIHGLFKYFKVLQISSIVLIHSKFMISHPSSSPRNTSTIPELAETSKIPPFTNKIWDH